MATLVRWGASSHITSKKPTKPIAYIDMKSTGTAKYTVNFIAGSKEEDVAVFA
jgi:hypothetical protein